MIFKSMDRIVFAGDSVTDAGSVQPVGEGLGDSLGRGYVRIAESMLAAYYPEICVRVTNSGISGNTSRDLLARFQRDVLELKPDYIVICIGINDVWRQFDTPAMAEYGVGLEEYASNLTQMARDSVRQAKRVFILSPYYMEPNTSDPMRARMDEYRGEARRTAEECGGEFIDIQAVFDDYFVYRHSSYIAWDRVHPNQTGATLIARAFLDRCGFDPLHIPRP